MPRQIFKRCVIALAGPLPGQLTSENVHHWTRIRKGGFSEDFGDDVTHLLCTREQFKKRVPRVKDALKRTRRLHIVHYDWFEFSTVHGKKEKEADYSMRNILAEENAARREKARILRGIRNGEKFVNTNLFHIYHDREFFAYQIDITRDDEVTGNVGQRYTLCGTRHENKQLWESNAKPCLYWFTVKFLKRSGDSQPSYYRPSPCAGKWRGEMDLFVDFFRRKTGVEWQDRVIREKTTPVSCFQYTPPGGGKPVGRRLRFELDYCREVNAQLRGLPWPPPPPAATAVDVDTDAGADADAMERRLSPDTKEQACHEFDEDGNCIEAHDEKYDQVPAYDTDSGEACAVDVAMEEEDEPCHDQERTSPWSTPPRPSTPDLPVRVPRKEAPQTPVHAPCPCNESRAPPTAEINCSSGSTRCPSALIN